MTAPGQYPQASQRPGGRPRLIGAVTQWRDWNIPIKLVAVMLVPVVVAIALGFVVITQDVGQAAGDGAATRITDLSATVRTAVGALQAERQQVATAGIVPRSPAARAAVVDRADSAVAAARAAVATNTGALAPVALSAWATVDRQLAELPSVRAQGAGANPAAEVGTYTQVIGAALAFDRVLTSALTDPTASRAATALHDLSSAREEIEYQQAVVSVGIGRGALTPDEVAAVRASEARADTRTGDFLALAGDDDVQQYQAEVGTAALADQRALLTQAIDGSSPPVRPGRVLQLPIGTWTAANAAVADGLNTVIDRLAGQVRDVSAAQQDQASNAAGIATVVLFTALMIAAATMAAIARQLLRSIGLLRRTARDIAAVQLPAAVEQIRVGQAVDTTVRPVPVHTTDEVGQLARAFDAMHGEALKLAVEQASLRGNYNDLFINLSRRSQSLVQRQLRLIEQLERDEEDPDQLSALFKLDHLATRMRRNNENLMVLSGSDLGRGPSQPVALTDLLRASVSEIEHYQRVTLQPSGSVQVLGYAAGDLVRLLAELLDNATAFSAPETPVTIASHSNKGRAVVVDIVDHGIGMSDEDLVAANNRLSNPLGVEQRVSRRMGLFVVSRLASEHGIRVRLHGGDDIPGLRVTVTVPPELVITDPDEITPAWPAGPGPTTDGVVPEYGGRNGTNGAVRHAGNGHVPRRADDPATTAMTVTIPRLRDSAAPGPDLFNAQRPADDRASGAGTAERVRPQRPAAELAATTPIFDTMASVWFHDVKSAGPDTRPNAADTAAPAREPEAAPREETASGGWEFAADDGWRAVDAVSQQTPTSYTTTGLPRRQPKARLLPGSVGDPAVTAQQPAVRFDADRVRDRLAGFQRGVRRGRDESGTEPQDGVRPDGTDTTAVRVDAAVRVDTAVHPATATGPATVTGWPSADDEGEHPADPPPPAYTDSGLPKRQPRPQVAANGSASARTAGEGVDAEAVRDRLNSFQRGARQGRDDTTIAASERDGHGFQQENE